MFLNILKRKFSFKYQNVFETKGNLDIPYKKLTSDYVKTIRLNNQNFLQVDPKGIELLSYNALLDISHFLRPGHLQQLRKILDDPESSSNDKFVALELLKNANIAAGKVLPGKTLIL
jgi:fumarate hydratase class I